MTRLTSTSNLGACCSDDAARRAVERAVGTEEGALWLEFAAGADVIDVVPEKEHSTDTLKV